MSVSAGYSGTPLPRKLGIRPGASVLLVDAPAGFRLTGVEADLAPAAAVSDYDVILLFATDAAALPTRFAQQVSRLTTAGGLWVCWPKRTARGADLITSDLDSNAVREIGLAAGLVDNKVCAVDATWSGLRFVRRRSDR